MKYTRFDLKRKNNMRFSFPVIIVGILVFAFITGTIISNLFIKNSNNNQNPVSKPNKNAEVVSKNNSDSKDKEKITNITEYTAIQCGVFSKKENAEKLKSELASIGKPFLVNEDNKFKVMFGIYSQDKLQNTIKLLDGKDKDYSQIKLNLDPKDECDVQISKMIDANLQIIYKLYDNKVKKIQTRQIKDWASKLGKVKKESKNYNQLVSIKNNISKLPKEMAKENIEAQNLSLYKILKQIK